jgi:hypothetical protein
MSALPRNFCGASGPMALCFLMSLIYLYNIYIMMFIRNRVFCKNKRRLQIYLMFLFVLIKYWWEKTCVTLQKLKTRLRKIFFSLLKIYHWTQSHSILSNKKCRLEGTMNFLTTLESND